MNKIISSIKAAVFFILGSLHWELPPWLAWLVRCIKQITAAAKNEHQHHRKRFYLAASAIVIVLISAGAGYVWYTNLPQPVRLSVSTNEIGPTPLRKDAIPDTFRIEFGGSAAKIESVGKPVTEGIRMSPPIEGQWQWESDNKLVFTIKEDWPIDVQAKITLDKGLFANHVHLETYEIELETPPFEVSIVDISFYQDPRKEEEKRVVAEVHFTHPVDPKSIEEKINFTFLVGGKEEGQIVTKKSTGFSATYDEFFGKAFLSTDILPIPNYDSTVELVVDKDVRSSRKGAGSLERATTTTDVPGMLTHFRIEGAEPSLVRNQNYEPEQVLILTSTAGVNERALSKHLEVYRLPVDRPKRPNEKKASRNYRWHDINEVSKEVLNLSTPLNLTPIPTPQDYPEVVSYKYKESPGRHLFVRVKKGLTCFGGYRLTDDVSFLFTVPEFPKELKIMAEGSLLSLTGEKKLSILARNLKHVRYRAQRLLPGQIAHFVSQSSGELGSPNFNNYDFGFENIAETFSRIEPLPITGEGKTQYSHVDFSHFIEKIPQQPKGLFYFIAEGWNKARKQQSGPTDERFILITDLGLLEKKSLDGSHDLFVQSIANGTPVVGAQVQVIGQNGLPVLTRVTDASGHVNFPNLNDFTNEKNPVVFVARKGEDLSFLPIRSHIQAVNYSRYDIGGAYSSSQSDQTEGYLFSDRGIYRPGETAHIGFIVKQADWGYDLTNLNLEMQVTDPKGSMIRRKKVRLNRVGFETYTLKTAETWPTGTYTFSLHIVKKRYPSIQIGTTTIKVEEFMPDRMKITARFSRPANKGWLSPEQLQGVVNLQNLFGTPAQNRRVVGELALAPSYPSFYALKEWNFHDPMHSKKSFSEKLGEQQTDAEGNAVFDLGLEKFDSASFLMRFIAEGFEPDGGRSVLASSTVLISPLQHLVGYKAQGDLSFIKKGTQIGVDWIAVDPDLNKIAVPDLTLKTIEFRQISTLVKQANGTYKYESVKKEYVNKSESFSISAAPTPFMLPTSIPGDFAIAITDTKGVELNRVPFRVSGEANLTFELEKNTELKIALNKSDYDPGEEIEISIQAPYSGAGLITIEKERLYAHKWFKTDSNSTIQRIAIPSELEGNGYINVTFVRSLASDEIFMSPMSTGVAPFSISKASRINKIDLALPPLVRPGKDLAITLSAQKPGKAVVFAVDEGILQVAKYINPDPLNSFYKKRALEVETRQILNLILPEFSKLQMRRSSEAGGAASLLGKNLNPFKRKGDKPVAYWSGLIDVGPEPQTLTYTVPDYFAGQLRVIAVAVSQLAMDAASDQTIVKGHFVLMPNVPNFVAPGDQLKISVGVSNQAKNSGAGAEVQLDLSTSKNIDPIGAKSSALTIDEGSEGSAGFDLKVKEPLGNATLSFVASHGDKTSRRTVTTSVRPAMPYISMIKAGYVDAGKAVQVPAQRNMFAAHRTNEISVSKLPLSMARNFAAYLRKYPYGCTEQLVSKGFPAIVLAPYTDFGIPTNKAADQVQGIAEILASRQLPDGGFIKWPGHPHINVFHTAYAVHYLTEAKDRGYRIPNHLMRDALAYLKEYAEREPEQLEMARVQAYGAYLLCRNGINATQALTAIEKWLDGYEDKAWVKDIMVLFMASAYKIMNANDKAWKLLDQFDATAKMAPEYHHGVFDDTIKQAMRLFLLSTHFPERLDEFKGDDLNSLVTSLSASFNTTSSALALLAFEAYGKHVDAPSNDGIDVQQTIDDQKSALALEGTLFPKAAVDAGIQSIKITNDTDAVLFYALTQAGFDSEPSVNKQTNGIEIFKEFVNNDGDVVQKATIGEELTVRIKGRTVSGADAWNVAIVDLLPGGFEVVLDSIDRRAGHVEYVDVREDRVLVFGNFSERVAVYEYKIKAVNRGTYTVPPIYAESMYNRQLWAKGITKKIVVE